MKRARRYLSVVEEIAPVLASELARWLASELGTDIDLYSDEILDYCEFKRRMVAIFRQACDVPKNGLPPGSDLTSNDYRRFVGSVTDFIGRVRDSVGEDYYAQAAFVEVLETLETLERQRIFAIYLGNLRDGKRRFRVLGAMGYTLLRFDEVTDRVLSQIPKRGLMR